jgi:hypothetical protein
MKVILHYTLHGGNPDAHDEVKNQMKGMGYEDYFFGPNNVKYYLPNTSLWHSNKPTLQNAVNDLNNVVDNVNRNRVYSNKARINPNFTVEPLVISYKSL